MKINKKKKEMKWGQGCTLFRFGLKASVQRRGERGERRKWREKRRKRNEERGKEEKNNWVLYPGLGRKIV
jgi:hypothetical protein